MTVPDDFPQTESSVRIGRAVEKMKTLPAERRVELMVKANLLTREEADRVIERLTPAGAKDSSRSAESAVAGS